MACLITCMPWSHHPRSGSITFIALLSCSRTRGDGGPSSTENVVCVIQSFMEIMEVRATGRSQQSEDGPRRKLERVSLLALLVKQWDGPKETIADSLTDYDIRLL
uniref:Uncharacterized protein n=1 Tax=Nelumbo nucifera TaxID=4432 RepID=A0A822XXC4_NELNU|nr:TPA_asm: hypothetical protein HUJ06_027732 [Nelumbo nucifera]